MVSLTNYQMTSLCLTNKTSLDLESENTTPHWILSSRKFKSQGSFSKHMITFPTTKSIRSYTTSCSMFSIQSPLASRVFFQETRTVFPPMLSQLWVTAILNHSKLSVASLWFPPSWKSQICLGNVFSKISRLITNSKLTTSPLLRDCRSTRTCKNSFWR